MLSSVGAGDGRVLLSAISAGASGATGYELPDNKGHKMLFDCVKLRCDVQGKNHAQWEVIPNYMLGLQRHESQCSSDAYFFRHGRRRTLTG